MLKYSQRLIEGRRSTLELHTVDGALTLERSLLHAALVKEVIEAAGGRVGRNAVLYMGGPASGKTSAYERLGPKPNDGYVYVNVDVLREKLPEYREMVEAGDVAAAELTHDEASLIAKRCVVVARTLGRSAATSCSTPWAKMIEASFPRLLPRFSRMATQCWCDA